MNFGPFLKGCLSILFVPSIWAASPVYWIEDDLGRPDKPDFNDVVWTGSSFLVCGTGHIAESPDGETWTPIDVSSFPPETYRKIVAGPDTLILGRDHGLLRPEFPLNGDVWHPVLVPESWILETVVYDGSRFLVVQKDNSLLASSDGQTWATVAGAPPLEFNSMVAGNGVLLGYDADTFYRSTDGLSWTEVDQEAAVNEVGSTRYLPEVSYVEFSGGKFVATMIRDTEFSFNTYAVSTDGLTWTLAETPPYEVNEEGGTTGVTLGGGGEEYGTDLEMQFVHLTDAGEPVVVYYYRQAINLGLPWDESDREPLRKAASNPDGVVVAAGADGFIVRSESPLEEYSWQDVGIKTATILNAVSNGEIIIGLWMNYDRMNSSFGGPTQIRASRDGITWEDVILPDGATYEGLFLKLVNHRWFLTEYEETLYTSNDGINWATGDLTSITIDGGGPFGDEEEEVFPLATAYGNGVYFGAGIESGFTSALDPYEGTPPIAKSTDGIHWSPLPEQLSEVTAIAFGGGEFMALEDSRGFRSSDGETWEEFQVEGLPDAPISLEYFRGRWLASRPWRPFSTGNFKMISQDGRNWEEVEEVGEDRDWSPTTFIGLFELNGHHIAGRNAPTALSSKSGLVWEVSGPVFGDDIFSASGNWFTVPLGNRLVAVGDDSRMIQSEPLVPVPAPPGLEILDPSHLEAKVSSTVLWRLEYSNTMAGEDWSPRSDWRSATVTDPYLFWKTSTEGESGYYRLRSRPLLNR